MKFLEFIKLLVDWRKLIIINILVVGIIAVIISFILPKYYKSSALIMPPDDQSLGSGLSGLLSGLPTDILGMGNIGGSNGMNYLAILKSKSMALEIIDRFKLKEYYEKETIDETLLSFYSDYDVQFTEEFMIQVSFEYTDPKIAAEIVNSIVYLLGKKSNDLMLQRAMYSKTYIEKRYFQNLADIDSLSRELESFQEKYGVFDFGEQIKSMINSVSEIEAQIYLKRTETDILENLYGTESPITYKSKLTLTSIENQLKKLKNNIDVSEKSFFLPLDKIPALGREYAELYTDLSIQNKLREFLLPQYEQAKIQLLKDKPSLQVIDYAIPSDKYAKPKKVFVVFGAVFCSFLFTLIYILMIQYLKWIKEHTPERFTFILGMYKKINPFAKLFQ